MLDGLWKLTWLEIKIFMREPMGAVSTIAIPLVLFLGLGRYMSRMENSENYDSSAWVASSLPVMVIIVIALNNVVSLTAIMSIYREGGILKRLKATPLKPYTILTAHVLVKMLLTSVNILIMILAGRTFFSIELQGSVVGFIVAVTISTTAILSLGFIIASIVPTARFAQLIATSILYPLLVLSGLFTSLESFPPMLRTAALFSPLTHAVQLTDGAWNGAPLSQFGPEIVALLATTIICVALSTKLFRWE
jgi:ABC-2 type transport system permease protein